MGREGGLPRMLRTTDFFRIVPTSLGARNSFFLQYLSIYFGLDRFW